MTKIFTPNDVIRFIYGEVISACEKNEIMDALNSNSDLYNLYFELSSIKRSLHKIKKEPSNNCIEKILQFSKNSNLHALPK